VMGWLPGDGRLAEAASEGLAAVSCAERPIAVSMRGWREDPGLVGRLRPMPAYLARSQDVPPEVRRHVVHANTLRSLPEARVPRRLGLAAGHRVRESQLRESVMDARANSPHVGSA
jgi:hypothetical protein